MATLSQKIIPSHLDMATKRGFVAALIMDFGLWILWIAYFRLLPVEVPLWYSLPYGPSLLAHKAWLGIIPALATGSTLTNLILVWWWRKFQPVLLALMAWSSALVALLMLIAFVHIVVIVL